MKAKPLIAAAFLVAMACLAAGSCRNNAAPVVITQATFGVYRTQVAGQVALQSTRHVPLAPGQQYGWLIRLKTNRSRIRWREDLRLPAPPRTWGTERVGARAVSGDNRAIVTEREVDARSGYIFNAWQVEPGDPAGRYTIIVSIEDGPSRRFDFDLN
jgi:hypothetical protein